MISDYTIWMFWAILIFGVVYGIFKINIKTSNPLKDFRFWFIWIIATPGSYIIAFISFIFVISYTPSNDFSTEAWNSNVRKRTELIDDLLDSKKLDNLHEYQIIELLGEPLEDSQYFKSDMIYNLGTERGFMGIDDEWLLIWLKDSIVVRYEVRSD